MDGTKHADYFLEPQEIGQRRYEALRAVIVEQQPMQAAAQRFGVSYGTVRNWVGEFRRLRTAGQQPLFSRPRHAVAPRSRTALTSRRSPARTSPPYPWSPDGGCSRGTREYSCSGPSWRGWVLIAWSSAPAIPARRWFLPPTHCSACSS